MNPRFIKPLVLSIVVAGACYFAAITFAGTGNVLSHLRQVPAWGLALVLALSLCNYLLRFTRWHRYMSHLGNRLPKTWHLMYYLAGFGLATTPAKAGETIRSVYLKNHGVTYTRSIAGLIAERVTDIIAIVVISSFAIAQFGPYSGLIAAVVIAAVMLVMVLRLPRLQRRLEGLIRSLNVPALQRGAAWLVEMIVSASDLLSARVIAAGVAIGLVAWSAEAFGFYLIVSYLDLGIALPVAMSIFAVSILIGALSGLPGGLGSAEAVMAGLLLTAGVEPAMAVATTVLCRVTTLWFAVALGLGIIATLEWFRHGLLFAGSVE